jgi:hypothetical protein
VDLATGAPLLPQAGPLVLVFTRPVDVATIGAGILVLNGGVAVPGAFSTDLDGHRAIFTPTTVLAPTADPFVEVRVLTTLLDTSGQAHAYPSTFRFAPLPTVVVVESEPNDVPDGIVDPLDLALADLLALGPASGAVRASGGISAGTDVDVYSFSGLAGQRLTATVLGTRGALSGSTRLGLHDSTGVEIAQGTVPFNGDPFVDFTFTVGGTYYLAVVDNGASGVPPGTYELQVVLD